MKKIMSSILIISLLMGVLFSSFTVSSENADISGSDVREWIELLANNMPEDRDTRIEVFNYLKELMKTDDGIKFITDLIEADTLEADPMIKKMLDALVNVDVMDYKQEMLFALNFIKSIPEATREEYIDAFSSRTSPTLSDSNKTKLKALYEELVPVAGQDKLDSHNVNEGVIFNLFEAMEDLIVITDTADGKGYALKSIDPDFKIELEKNLADFSSINGKEFNTAEELFAIIFENLSDDTYYNATFINNTKAVLEAINLYEPLDTESPEPTAEPTAEPTDTPTDPPTSTRRPNRGTTVAGGGETTPTLPPTPTPVNYIPEPTGVGEENIFPDTTSHWSRNYIGAMSGRGVFVGYEDGNFEPGQSITRQEMAVVMVRALGVEDRLGEAVGQEFADGGNIAEWASAAVRLMVDMGIYTGYDDGEFKPTNTITREELVALIVRITNTRTMHEKLYYTDATNIGDWAKDYVNEATALGIIGGYEDLTFQPKNAVTRAEAAKIIYNFMSVQGLL